MMLKRLRDSRRADGTIVAVVASLLIILAIVAVIILVPVKTLTYDQTKSVELKEGVNTMELTMNADIAEIHLAYEDLVNKSLEVRVQAKAQVGILDQSTNIMTFNLQSSVSGNKLLVNVLTDLADWLALGPWTTVNVTAVMNKNLFAYTSATTGTGSLWMTAAEGAHVNTTVLRTSTGDATINLEAGAILGGNLGVTTTTGMITMECAEVELANNALISLTDTTGSVRATVIQVVNMSHSLSVQMNTITGSINCVVEIAGSNGALITATPNLGSVHVNHDPSFSVSTVGKTTSVTSNNYPSGANVVAVATTNTGSISIDATYLLTVEAL